MEKKKLYIIPIICLCLGCQSKEKPLFQLLPTSHTGIDFTNTITEDDTYNILNFTNLYTGSGVGIADFDKDGLPDIFLGGNMESSRFYLNKGDLQFEDITKQANVQTDRWITGVAIADVNADGWQDIYLGVSGKATTEKRKNLLFINQGSQVGGVQFKETAESYGIADTSQCTHANFLDYDKDGDLDLFMIVNPTDYALYNVNSIRKKKVNGESASTDKLYRNNLVETGQTTFTDVSKEAGILIEGYSLGLNVSDLNGDNYPDIYITNDFLTNDILYINNQDGTFTNQAKKYFKHTSFASMGIDIADINNDGLPEVYVLDMFPEDNYRQKMIMGNNNYDRFQYMLKMGYEPQYSRNTLQLNNGDNTFSEMGQLAGVYQTDWSWSALLADYNNDGLKDLFVTNGFRRDLGDLDYINYQNNNAFGNPEGRRKKQLEAIVQQPGAQLPNYIFQNENGLRFNKKSSEWGIDQPSYSHGAAFADLDVDGDLDLVVNNVSQPTFIYENTARKTAGNHYLQIDLVGTIPNQEALGTKVWLHTADQIQFIEHTPYRGYQSTIATNLHFGLGETGQIDSIRIHWYDGTWQTIVDVPVDSLLQISKRDRTASFQKTGSSVVQLNRVAKPVFQEQKNVIGYYHQEDIQIDFKSQLLLPHQHSKVGPPMTVADINGDGLDDVFVGGAAGHPGQFFIQASSGKFQPQVFPFHSEREDTDCHFFDADQDGDMDLYVVSGGVVYSNKKDIYQDRLYLNDGLGQFTPSNALPEMPTSGGSVAVTDFDQDGDQDIFIGGRVTPNQYPTIPNSYLLENQNGIYKDITPSSLSKIGMVTDALWTDYDNDGDEDLMIAGEFMPITYFKNEAGKILNSPFSILHSNGWWNTLAQGDFDQDGDIDFLAGNLGLNSDYRASVEEPFCVYAKDFDKNGSLDPVFAQFTAGKEYPIPSRDQLISQIAPIKVRFTTYKKYAEAELGEVLKRQEQAGAQVLESYLFESSYIENVGNGHFEVHVLPVEMQMAPINDFLVKDVNGDGHLDALAVGNNYATAVNIGRYDAFTGGLLVGDGQGNFKIKRGAAIGMVADKDARRIVNLQLANQQEIFLISNNSDSLQVFLNMGNNHIDHIGFSHRHIEK